MAHKADAKYIYPMFGVTLRENQRDYFFRQIDKLFPGTRQLYIKRYGYNYACHSPKRALLKKVFIEECKKYHIAYKMEDIIKGYQKEVPHIEQISFDF